MTHRQTQHRWPHLAFTRVERTECVHCNRVDKCFIHVDYPGMAVCEDCFDRLSPPVDAGDHSNHWRHEDWDSVARAIGREVVPHGVMQDGVYYPAGVNPPVNRPPSYSVKRFVQPGDKGWGEAERRAFVRRELDRLKHG